MFIILNDDEDDETVGCCYEAIWPVEARVRSGNVSTRGFIVESLWRIVRSEFPVVISGCDWLEQRAWTRW